MQAVVIPVTPFAQNCSLVWCPRTLAGAVIDPGGDLEQVQVGDVEFDVQHCPGHTPGHVTFHCAADKIAFVGVVASKRG